MSSLLNIGTQALTANQSALSYTGQNIANVNTEGYSRQRVNFETQQPPILGVAIQDVQRITDQYLVDQVWRDQSAYSSTEQQAEKMALLDKLMVTESTNLSSALDSYFNAMQRMVDDPLYIANRQLFIAEAESLVGTFQTFDQRLLEQQTAVATEARSMVSSVNAITDSLARLNVQISKTAYSGQNYNSLIDERDQLIKELSSYVSIDVVTSDNITTNVLLANGEPLVSAGRAATLTIRDGDPNPAQIDVVLSRGNSQTAITELLGEGALGGLFSYRDEVLEPVRAEIGRIAIVLSTTMNEQHRQGMDLDGNLGVDLFAPIKEVNDVYAVQNNTTAGVSTNLRITDAAQLTGSDYEIEVVGPDQLRVKRLSDGVFFDASQMDSYTTDYGTNSQTITLELEGFTFALTSSETPRVGDRYLLQPTVSGTRLMDFQLRNPNMLALASPIRIEPANTNQGNAELTSIEVLNYSDQSPLRSKSLEPPVEIVFNAPEGDTFTVYDMSDPSDPQVFDGMADQIYTAGEPIVINDIFGNPLYQLTLTNQAKPGDRFVIDYNTDGVSDNKNALALANLQTAETSQSKSYQDAYGQLLAKVGTQANVISVAFSANATVLAASEEALESVRGVNLDEEATKLIQYQQAYVASTRLITAYQDLFDSLISAVR